MGRSIALREDFDGRDLRRLAKVSKDAGQSRRLLSLAEIYDGGRRTDAARIGAVGLQVVRDWVLRFNADGPDGLIDGKAPGKPPKLNASQRRALARIVESGPIPAIHGVVRWRRKWSCPAYVPVFQLIYAAFRSNAKGLLLFSDEWRRREL